MHTFICDDYPLAVLASPFPFPNDRAVVVASAPCDWRNQRVRPCGEAVQFDHPEWCAANLRSGCVKNQVPLLEQNKTANEQVNADASTQNAPEDWTPV